MKLCVILARGGSKRIPRKNLVDFNGRPLLAWTVEAAVRSACFDRVLVSTDDPEIAAVGRSFGGDVPFLRESAADDQSPSSAATLVALDQAESHWRCRFSTVSQLMANCPLRSADDIRRATEAFEASGSPSQLSCFRFGWMNPWWAVQLGGDFKPTPVFPDALGRRSQDLPPLFCPTGAIWIARTSSLREHRSFYLPGHTFFPMDWIAAIDIDDEEDLRMARSFGAIPR